MKNLKRTKKAYGINFNKIEEGFLYCEQICFAEKITEAKTKLLDEMKYDTLILKGEDEECTYLNIPVIRFKEYDTYEFDGGEYSISEIEAIKAKKERLKLLDNIINDDNIQYCYIRKGNYYRPNHCGYTSYKKHAGVYTKEEAVICAKSCNELSIIPINIDEHNNIVNKEIEVLKGNLITRVDG